MLDDLIESSHVMQKTDDHDMIPSYLNVQSQSWRMDLKLARAKCFDYFRLRTLSKLGLADQTESDC